MGPTTLGSGERSSVGGLQEKARQPSFRPTLDLCLEQRVGLHGLRTPFQILYFVIPDWGGGKISVRGGTGKEGGVENVGPELTGTGSSPPSGYGPAL